MKDPNLVSIVMCTYNGASFLKPQLDSLINQTYSNIEIIVVDDCSTDNTRGILDEYTSYSQIKIIYNASNLGLIRNFEKALLLATGEYIAFADQDDIWELNKISILHQSIGNHSLIYSDSLYVDAEGKSLNIKVSDFRKPLTKYDPFLLDPESGIWIAGHATLFNRKLIELAVPFNQYINHDTWIVSIAMFQQGIKYIPNVLTKYRQHSNNQVGGVGYTLARKKKKQEVITKSELFIGKMKMLQSIIPENELEFRFYLETMLEIEQFPSLINRLKKTFLRFKYAKRIYALRKRNLLRIYFRIIKSF